MMIMMMKMMMMMMMIKVDKGRNVFKIDYTG
jgi:hypothetical protein